MSSRYELTSSEDGHSYQFTTDSGDKYTAYFTEFFLQDENGNEVKIASFGFERLKNNPDKRSVFDPRVKATIIYIIQEYFRQNGYNALLYLCVSGDGKARNRSITFSNWFKDLSGNFSKFDSNIKHRAYNFYSSLIVSNECPHKDAFVKAFYFTIQFWMGE